MSLEVKEHVAVGLRFKALIKGHVGSGSCIWQPFRDVIGSKRACGSRVEI